MSVPAGSGNKAASDDRKSSIHSNYLIHFLAREVAASDTAAFSRTTRIYVDDLTSVDSGE